MPLHLYYIEIFQMDREAKLSTSARPEYEKTSEYLGLRRKVSLLKELSSRPRIRLVDGMIS